MVTRRTTGPVANREMFRGALNTEGCITMGLPTTNEDQSTFKLRRVVA